MKDSRRPLTDRIHPAFTHRLGPFDLADLERQEDTIYAIDRDGRLVYVNPAWDAFALQNGGESTVRAFPIGSPIGPAMQGPLGEFFARAFAAAAVGGEPWEHEYDCSSPTRRRRFRMRVYPLGDGGLLIVHSLSVEEPIQDEPSPPLLAGYRNDDGIVVQCGHCRRSRRAGTTATWDWVPQFVERPPPFVSHGLCDTCLAFYWKRPDGGDGG